MRVPDFRSLTVEELVAKIKGGELTAAAVTNASLARIDEVNPLLNAFVAVDAEDARKQATAIDGRLEAGDDVGPLAGVPIGVKDLEDARGFVTTRGSLVTGATAPAAEDSTEVARRRAAGCVVLGKTNCARRAAAHTCRSGVGWR
jgi:Asp-tRNA(Asn)/Glu-tRNA(Gln) amidotransferase A subunit family amidase